jgi:DNA helicase HerA-like ATPase
VSDLAKIAPTPGDRVFIAGQTGSGKTTLARVLLYDRAFVVVLDSKGTLAWPEYTLQRDLDALIRDGLDPEKNPRVIFRPPFEAPEYAMRTLDKFFRWVYLRGHCTVYIDETFAVTRGNLYVEHYGACLTRGREKGIEVWSGTQRPMDIPQIAISEAEHAYVFKLRLPQDRAKVEATAGIPQDQVMALQKRQFLYSEQAGDVQGPFSLNIAGLTFGHPVRP